MAGRFSLRFEAAALVLGVALSAFFDGILLHQVLQWHHLLSLVDGAGLRDLQTQVLADGLFHVAVYLILALGLWLLWGRRQELGASGAGRALWGSVILGFGLWNVIDVVGFHWLAGIHRIRVGVPDPLAWDLGWLALLGFVPLALGAWVRKNRSGGGGRSAATALSVLLVVMGALALRPAPGAATAVMFRPGMSQSDAIAVAARHEAQIAAIDHSGRVLVLRLPPGANPWRLYLDGALLVGGAGPAGCSTYRT